MADSKSNAMRVEVTGGSDGERLVLANYVTQSLLEHGMQEVFMSTSDGELRVEKTMRPPASLKDSIELAYPGIFRRRVVVEPNILRTREQERERLAADREIVDREIQRAKDEAAVGDFVSENLD